MIQSGEHALPAQRGPRRRVCSTAIVSRPGLPLAMSSLRGPECHEQPSKRCRPRAASPWRRRHETLSWIHQRRLWLTSDMLPPSARWDTLFHGSGGATLRSLIRFIATDAAMLFASLIANALVVAASSASMASLSIRPFEFCIGLRGADPRAGRLSTNEPTLDCASTATLPDCPGRSCTMSTTGRMPSDAAVILNILVDTHTHDREPSDQSRSGIDSQRRPSNRGCRSHPIFVAVGKRQLRGAAERIHH